MATATLSRTHKSENKTHTVSTDLDVEALSRWLGTIADSDQLSEEDAAQVRQILEDICGDEYFADTMTYVEGGRHVPAGYVS